jgi:hypothetical protein
MEKLKTLLRRFRYNFPITPWGLLFLVLCGLAFWFFAVKELDIIYLSMSVLWGGIFILMIAWVLVVAYTSRKKMKNIHSLSFIRMTVGIPTSTGFYIPSFIWTPFINVTWAWEKPQEMTVDVRKEGGRSMEIVTAERRGFYEEITRKIEVGDVFGFTRIRWEQKEPTRIEILPRIGKLTNMNMFLAMFRGEDISHPDGMPEGDRIEIRQYCAGDSFKSIMWKIYAQTRKLYVRIPETAIAVKPRVAAYLVSGRGDETTASLARIIIENRMLGREWIFGSDGSTRPATEQQDALINLAKSGNFRKLDIVNLRNFLDYAVSKGAYHCLVILPPDMQSWKDEIVEVAQSKTKLHFMTVFDKPCKESEKLRDRVKDILIEKEDRHAHHVPDHETVLKALPRTNGSIFLVDRKTGKMFREGNLCRDRWEQVVKTK